MGGASPDGKRHASGRLRRRDAAEVEVTGRHRRHGGGFFSFFSMWDPGLPHGLTTRRIQLWDDPWVMWVKLTTNPMGFHHNNIAIIPCGPLSNVHGHVLAFSYTITIPGVLLLPW